MAHRILLVDDVITTGATATAAARALLNAGAGGGSVRLVGALRDDGLALGNVSSLVDAQEGR